MLAPRQPVYTVYTRSGSALFSWRGYMYFMPVYPACTYIHACACK